MPCITTIIIHQIFSLKCDWSKHVRWPNITQLKLEIKSREYPRIFPNFQCKKDLTDNKNNSLHYLGRKHVPIFVPGHNLFVKAHCFPQAMLGKPFASWNRWFGGQISQHNFMPDGGYFLFGLYSTNFLGASHTICSPQELVRNAWQTQSVCLCRWLSSMESFQNEFKKHKSRLSLLSGNAWCFLITLTLLVTT